MSEQTSFQLKYTGEQVDERLEKAGQAVLYTEQSLDFAKKAQARDNIGATAIHIGNDEPTDGNVTLWLDMDEESGGTESGGSSAAVLYTEQTLTEGQKAQARENIDAISNDLEGGNLENVRSIRFGDTDNGHFWMESSLLNGNARKPMIEIYGDYGDEAVLIRGVADGINVCDAVNVEQLKAQSSLIVTIDQITGLASHN